MDGDKKGRTKSKQNKERLFSTQVFFVRTQKIVTIVLSKRERMNQLLFWVFALKAILCNRVPLFKWKMSLLLLTRKKLAAVFYSSVAILVLFIFLSFDEVQQKFASKRNVCKKTQQNFFCNVLLLLLSLLMAKVWIFLMVY